MLVQVENILLFKKKREELLKLESKLQEGILTDFRMIDDIYKIVMIQGRDVKSATKQKMFLFLTILLYSPKTLMGQRLPYGMRIRLAKYFAKDKSVISQNLKSLSIMYMRYKDFREEVERLHAEIKENINY